MTTVFNGKNLIIGIVVASRWRKDGTVSGISIQGYDQKEYVVKLNEQGKKFLDSPQKTIRAAGIVSPTIDGRRIVTISEFEITTAS